MPVDTAACRTFIVDFQRRNPGIEEARFTDEWDEEGREAVLKPANWKRRHKLRPDSQTDDHDPVSSYGVYVDGAPVNHHAEHQSRIDAAEIAWERRFDCTPFDGQVAYLILETRDGRLLFGEYVGD